MLHFKPRMKVGSKVSTWKAINETKNRGKMPPRFGITRKDFTLNGYAAEYTNGNGIRLSNNGVGGTAASAWWRNEFVYPIDITCETYISGAADGIVICFQKVEGGSLNALGGAGGGIGFPSGNIMGITQDQWNNGQPVPYLGWHDGRVGMGYPAYYVNLGVNDGQWHRIRTIIEQGGKVSVYRDNILYLEAQWQDKFAYEIVDAPVWIGVTAGTGAATQEAYMRRIYVGEEAGDLYLAPNYNP